MVDLKLGNTTYSGIDRIQISKADSSGVVNFTPSDDIFAVFNGTRVGGLYENPYVTGMSKVLSVFLAGFDIAYLPNVVSLSNVIDGDPNYLKVGTLVAPKLTSSGMISWNGTVKVMDFTAVTAINNYGISGTQLGTVILRGGTMVTLARPDTQGNITQTIYVPSSLLSAYQADANWSQLLSKGRTFAAIEGSAYENTDWFRTAV